MASPHPHIVGRYALSCELASGGMATVYLGQLRGPAGFSPPVAVKRIHPWLAKDPHFGAMFADEARLAARIRHANVVPTLDVVAHEDELLLVMEYVHGESLAHLLRAAREADERIDLPIIAAIVFGVLSGLHAAHEAKDERGRPLGIVHRDISPENVMVGADGVARVLDFGIARATGQMHTTREGHLKGKLGYMAIEQASHGRIDRRVDVYATGIVLWEMLTLRRLFEGNSEPELLARVLAGATQPPSKYAEGIPPALDALVMRALAREPSGRFGTAREMAVALERCVRLATPLEVGAWVTDAARTSLAKRTEQLAALDANVALTAPGVRDVKDPSLEEKTKANVPAEVAIPAVDGVPSAPEPRSGLGTRAMLAGAVALAAFGAVVATAARGESVQAAPLPPVDSTPSTPPTPISSEPPPSAPPVPDTVVAPPPAPPARNTNPSTAPAAPAVRQKHDPCDPPYWYDAQGIKHYKVDCRRP